MRVNLTLRNLAAGAAMLASGTAAHADSAYCTKVAGNVDRLCYDTIDICQNVARNQSRMYHTPLDKCNEIRKPERQLDFYSSACATFTINGKPREIPFETGKACVSAVANFNPSFSWAQAIGMCRNICNFSHYEIPKSLNLSRRACTFLPENGGRSVERCYIDGETCAQTVSRNNPRFTWRQAVENCYNKDYQN